MTPNTGSGRVIQRQVLAERELPMNGTSGTDGAS